MKIRTETKYVLDADEYILVVPYDHYDTVGLLFFPEGSEHTEVKIEFRPEQLPAIEKLARALRDLQPTPEEEETAHVESR